MVAGSGGSATAVQQRPVAGVAALVLWMVAVGTAAGAVALVLVLRRSGGLLPATYLGNVWAAVVLPAAGLLLVGRAPYRWVGWLFSAGGVGLGLASLCFALSGWLVHADEPGLAGAADWLGGWTWNLGYAAAAALLLLPEGRARGWRWWLTVAAWAAVAARVVVSAFSGSATADPAGDAVLTVPNPLAVPLVERAATPTLVVTFFVMTVQLLAAVVHLTRRWWRSSGRDRTSVGLLALAAWVLLLPCSNVPALAGAAEAVQLPVAAILTTAALLRLQVSDVDLAVSRGYLWLSLTTCLVAAYVVVVSLLGAVVNRAAGTSVALAASGVVALLMAPLRRWLQRGVDRLLYGARADPYASVAALSRRLATNVAPDDVLPVMARTVTDELGLPYAAVRLDVPAGAGLAVAEHGAPRGDLVTLPIEYLGRHIGEMVVSTPAPGVALRPAERRLLTELARQAGAAAHGVAVVRDLRHARQRLVAAREQERQHLRRELHDDLGALLTSAALGVDATGNRLPPHSPVAGQLDRVRVVLSAAVGDLRRIIDGLRPPALDELGLLAALQDRFLTMPVGPRPAVQVAEAELPALPVEVEVACYHLVVEAVHNAVRHADAAQVRVRFTSTGGELEVTITDDGRGFDPATVAAGHGLVGMRERVTEIGGRFTLISTTAGTIVTATFPTRGEP